MGQAFPAALGFSNNSTPPDAGVTVSNIDFVPACANTNPDCPAGVEQGVFALSATGTGFGDGGCTGTWTITPSSPGA